MTEADGSRKTRQNILVFAEQEYGQIHPVAFEILGKARELADTLPADLHAVIAGPEGLDPQQLIRRGADTVHYIVGEEFDLPNELLYRARLLELIRELKPDIVLFGATHFGRSLAPRISAALRTGLTADCTGLEIDDDGRLIQIRPAFTENILAHIKTETLPQMATIRYREFPKIPEDPDRTGKILLRSPAVMETSVTESTTNEGHGVSSGLDILGLLRRDEVHIANAEVVVSGGAGLKNPDDFRMLRELAELLGGVVGASRNVVDRGFISREHQVGYSGNRVKPKIYFACGISGAPQHLAGMKESDTIVAVNTDPSAPIFKIADIGIVGDLYEIIPKLCRKIEGLR
jgi:electron transfer flavoprotein alpha subunit